MPRASTTPYSWKRPRPKSAAPRPPKKARRSPIRCMVRSATRSNTYCIATPCGRWPGATISATRVTGPSNSASALPRAAPTICGHWSPRAKTQERSYMTAALRFDPIRLPPECEKLRKEVRAFLAEEIAAGTFDPHRPQGGDSDVPGFSKRVGERGWIGMTWPKKYGGHERSFLERYVVTEEMRVANAPTRRFFVADRQSGPVLLKYAPEHIKMDILPRICRGEVCFSIGMSEPNSGSDLFAAKTRATKTDSGWLINGTKIWTSSAHIADYMIAIFRTSPSTKENRRHGLTQFLVDMKTPGIKVNSIGQITGQFEFNEVVFTDAFMPDDHVLGEIDGA